MSAQRYTDPTALAQMADGNCPECGQPPSTHINDVRFWIPRTCDLTYDGVTDRVAQAKADVEASR